MTLIARIGAGLLLLFIALPIASSTATGSQSCTQKEFWSGPNACCLPVGGPPFPPPPPPKGIACPPSSHYWGQKQGCCVPRHPPPKQGPPPQCPEGWTWDANVRKCFPLPTPPKPSPPKPSQYYGHGSYQQRRSSQLKSRSAQLCPTGLDACPIVGVRVTAGDYECLDTTTELESCGGCASLGSGQDCTAIPGVWNVGCDQGSCTVYTCAGGFKRSKDGKSCIPL